MEKIEVVNVPKETVRISDKEIRDLEFQQAVRQVNAQFFPRPLNRKERRTPEGKKVIAAHQVAMKQLQNAYVRREMNILVEQSKAQAEFVNVGGIANKSEKSVLESIEVPIVPSE